MRTDEEIITEEKTNMILFAIIGESLGEVENASLICATVIWMLIVCWAIYTVLH